MTSATDVGMEREFHVGHGAELSVSNVAGEIIIRTGDESVIRMRATKHGIPRAMDNTDIMTGQEGDRVSIRTESRSRGEHGWGFNFGRSMSAVRYEITVPRGCRVRAKAVSADVSVEGTGAPVTIQSVSGDVQARDVSGDCSLTTVSGDVVVDTVSGELTLRTTSGDARVTGGNLRRFNVNSVSGDFVIETPLTRGEHYFAKTVSGDLRVFVPPGTGATIQMKTLSGDVVSELPADIIKSGRRNWQGRVNGGGADLEMHSVSGDLRIAAGSGAAQPARHYEDSATESYREPRQPREPAEPRAVPATPPAPAAPERKTTEILAALERGDITVEEAMARLDQLS